MLIIPLIFYCCLLPYAIPAVMPSWRTLAVCVVLIGVGLAYLWHGEWLVEQDPGYRQGPGGFIGIGAFVMATEAFAGGTIVRAISLTLRRWSGKSAIIINTGGLVVVMGVFLYPFVSSAWALRSVSADCAATIFSFEIANAHLRIPASPLVTLRDPLHSYDLSHSPSLRDLCGRTNLGVQSVKATVMDLKFETVLGSRFQAMSCTDAATLLGPSSCPAFSLIQHGQLRQTDYPSIAHLFAPGGMSMGGHDVTTSTADDATNMKSDATDPFAFSEFFPSQQITPDGKPLTFACRINSSIGDEYYCHASYAWHDGAYLDYGFNAPPGHVVDKGEHVDATIRSVVDVMLTAN